MAARQPMSLVARTGCLVVFCARLLTAFPESDVTLRSGEKIEVSLDTPLSSRSSHFRDKVDATLPSDEVREGKVVLPAGAKLKGSVDAVQRADRRRNKRARLRLVFDEIVLPGGQVIPIKAFLEQSGPELSRNRHEALELATVAMVGMGSIGALIGLPINGLKGAGVGAAVGGGLGVLLGLAMLAVHWEDVHLYRGQKVLIQLDENMIVHVHPSPEP